MIGHTDHDWYRLLTAAMLGYTTMVAAFASSIFSAATETVAAIFGVSTEVGILGVSFYVLGFATGPILWAPLSGTLHNICCPALSKSLVILQDSPVRRWFLQRSCQPRYRSLTDYIGTELRGRRLPLLLSMFGFTIFQIAVASGKDLQTVLISRFFGGLFASCPLAVVAAVFSDM